MDGMISIGDHTTDNLLFEHHWRFLIVFLLLFILRQFGRILGQSTVDSSKGKLSSTHQSCSAFSGRLILDYLPKICFTQILLMSINIPQIDLISSILASVDRNLDVHNVGL